jgi:hypothetical protein
MFNAKESGKIVWIWKSHQAVFDDGLRDPGVDGRTFPRFFIYNVIFLRIDPGGVMGKIAVRRTRTFKDFLNESNHRLHSLSPIKRRRAIR